MSKFVVLGQSDSSTLVSIAELCPKEGGIATFRARSLLSIYGYRNFVDDSCNLAQPIVSNTKSNIRYENMNLVPNPATNSFRFFNDIGLKIEEVQIYSSTGVIIRQINCNDIKPSITLEGLKDGIYFVKISFYDHEPISRKLYVQK
jgi:hypothetical protein